VVIGRDLMLELKAKGVKKKLVAIKLKTEECLDMGTLWLMKVEKLESLRQGHHLHL
jgi:hypothetical protein